MFRFKRILCAVDFSKASVRALTHAVHLASLYGGRIHVLHVIPRIVPSLSGKPVKTSPWTGDEEAAAKKALGRLTMKATKDRIPLVTEIRIGDEDVQILDAARTMKADVIVMGTHGRRGFKRWILGSVAESMVRYSPVPLIVVGSPGVKTIAPRVRRVLVPTDFSKGSAAAVGCGLEIAKRSHASITLLHVMKDLSAAAGWKASAQVTAGVRDELDALIPAQARRECEVKTVVEIGEPYQVILNTMKRLTPDLVVMNTHGHGFVDRLLIGSTAERVVRGGAGLCPVVLIPPGRH